MTRCYNCTRAMAKKLILLFLLAFILRILLINVAYHGDLYNNLSWGQGAVTHGLENLYEVKEWSHSIPNQPPLYILLFATTSFIYQTISNLTNYLNNNVSIFPSSFVWFWQNNGNIILLKLPSILADLGIAFVIFKFFKKKDLGFKLAALWLFNPITFYNSAIWGQTDSIVNLLGLISIFFLTQKKLLNAMLFLTLSLLFKGSLAIFIPILFVYAIWQKYDLQTWIKAILVSGVAAILVSVWFHPYLDLPIWLLNLYNKQILPGEIGDLSANAFNFWYLVSHSRILDSTVYFGLTARIWGYAILIASMAAIVLKLNRNRTTKNLFYSLTLIALATFLFMTRIHERYLYPFFPVATILVGFRKKFLIPYLVLSFTFLLNMYNLFWAPGIPVLENILRNTQLPSILAVINLVVFVVTFSWVILNHD